MHVVAQGDKNKGMLIQDRVSKGGSILSWHSYVEANPLNLCGRLFLDWNGPHKDTPSWDLHTHHGVVSWWEWNPRGTPHMHTAKMSGVGEGMKIRKGL